MSMLHVMDDAQARPHQGTCEGCGGELWGGDAEAGEDGRVYCPACREAVAEAERRAEIVYEVLEAMDTELKEYLADGPRDIIWNKMVRRFPVKEAG